MKNEKNYEIVFHLLHCPSYTKNEDIYLAFKEMLKENPIIHEFFQYGLLEKSWFSDLWKEYLKEMKSSLTGDGAHPIYKKFDFIVTNEQKKFSLTIDVIKTTNKKNERESIRKKMKNLLIDKG